MSAYGALLTVKNTIHHILHSCRLSLVSPSVEIIQVAYEELQPWDDILERLDESRKSKSRKNVNALDGRIKETLWRFEDLLESLLSHQIVLQSGSGGSKVETERDVFKLFSIDLRSLQDDVDSFIHTLEDMKEEYIYEVDNMPEDQDEDEDEDEDENEYGDKGEDNDEDKDEDKDEDGSSTGYSGTKTMMIGLSDQFEQLKKTLIDENSRAIEVLTIAGMVGVGKTTLIRKIYEDPEITSHFDCCLWIRVGRISSARVINQLKVSQSILSELRGDDKCLIVLDDVWDHTQELSSFLTSIGWMDNTIVRILLTTRDGNMLSYVQNLMAPTYTHYYVVRFLNEEESKELLCLKVFGENIICPPHLDKAATKIAKKCEGLPLTILTVADILSKSHNRDDLKYWEDVAEERNSVFADAYTEMSKVLFPSYDYLPQHLKMPFLYLGVFPRDYEIPQSKIINMLKAEDWFLNPQNQDSPENYITSCLADLCTPRNLVLFKPISSRWYAKYSQNSIKTCRLHSAWQQLCRGEARGNKFYHGLNGIGDASEDTIKGQRCLFLENNLLFGIKEFCNSVRCSNCASTTRSLLFFGPYHQYPTPIDSIGFKLLRQLNALQLRFYSFPTEILTLVQLKYLALTCNGQLPPTISKLFDLKVLIVHPHTSITKCYDMTSSYIPTQIWDMKELEHIEILGKSFLAAPPNDRVNIASSLEKVSTLVGVNADSIGTVTEGIPNVRKLGVQVELTPYDSVEHSSDVILSCFPHISTLGNLRTLKCSIINPVQVRKCGSCYSWAPTPSSLLMFPRRLRKLHLSGMGFPWKYMDVIGSLPILQVLKLRSYAFRGSKWETKVDSFLRLEYLLIEDSDLVELKPASRSFPDLTYLSLKHCYKLRELCWPSDDHFQGKIELVNCNPLAVTCANKLQSREGVKSVSVVASDHYEA